MRKLTLAACGVAAAALVLGAEANAAGRLSRSAAFNRLSNPFAVLPYSGFSANPFGLPSSTTSSTPVEEEAEGGETVPTIEFTPVQSSISRTPYRPPVRSPFRPPPRPPF